MAQTLKLIRKKDEITALNGKVIDSLDSNSSIDAPSIRAVNEHFGNISNANLLINGNFQVNQRGQTTYIQTNTWKYSVDRWKYIGLMNELFSDVNPVPVKTAMNILGMEAGPLRQPLYPMDESAVINLKNKLKECGFNF